MCVVCVCVRESMSGVCVWVWCVCVVCVCVRVSEGSVVREWSAGVRERVSACVRECGVVSV